MLDTRDEASALISLSRRLDDLERRSGIIPAESIAADRLVDTYATLTELNAIDAANDAALAAGLAGKLDKTGGVTAGRLVVQTDSPNALALDVDGSTTLRPYLSFYAHDGTTVTRRGYVGYPTLEAEAAMNVVSDDGEVRIVPGGSNRVVLGSGTGQRVAAPGMPHFHLRHSDDFTLGNGAAAAILWNTEVEDAWSMHSGTNGYVTIPTAGFWIFTSSVMTDNSIADGVRQTMFTRNVNGLPANNSTDARFGTASHGALGSQYGSLNSAAIIRCDAGDLIRVIAFQNTGATRTWGLANRRDLTHFSGQLLWATV